MKNILAALAVVGILAGCVVAPIGYPAEVAFEPAPVVGLYPVGYYYPGYGYWTGTNWDINFYAYGHRGYGHHYYVPREYYRHH